MSETCFFGKKYFKEFKEDKPDLSNKVLSKCLKDLEENGLIEKRITSKSSSSNEYSLTERRLALNKIIYELGIFTFEKCDFDDYKDEKRKKLLKISLNLL